ncbi:MAG TPA: HypC/HybG/HupF family hydrogenase formation chaperone [Acidimicrobiia bacterium]|nr:HypC/HybG/HupF family hydrogenase formation chaperone [Acidimicrobiia bacterium]
MCQAIAGRIDRIAGEGIDRRATVQVDGVERDVSLALTPQAERGDWVIFHSGYSLRVVSEEDVIGLAAILEGG